MDYDNNLRFLGILAVFFWGGGRLKRDCSDA